VTTTWIAIGVGTSITLAGLFWLWRYTEGKRPILEGSPQTIMTLR
jgi:hypothetical protein